MDFEEAVWTILKDDYAPVSEKVQRIVEAHYIAQDDALDLLFEQC